MGTFTIDGMAAYAVSRALEQGSATRWVADHQSAGLETAYVAKIRDDAGKFRGAEIEGLHGSTWDAVRDGKAEVIVGDDAFELPGAEIDAGNLIARGAVAGRALRGENLRAVLDVRLIVLGGAVLALCMSGRAANDENETRNRA